jgi:hypothetical protein
MRTCILSVLFLIIEQLPQEHPLLRKRMAMARCEARIKKTGSKPQKTTGVVRQARKHMPDDAGSLLLPEKLVI